MAIDVRALDKDQLKALIENHRNKGATDASLYRDALAELERKMGKGLDFDKSLRVIQSAAKDRRFLSYKELADASGAKWESVHYAIGEHLWRMVEWAHRASLPMLSAIVVNKPNIETGVMDAPTLKGFIGAAKELGYDVVDEESFLREQQERVFAWGEGLREKAD